MATLTGLGYKEVLLSHHYTTIPGTFPQEQH